MFNFGWWIGIVCGIVVGWFIPEPQFIKNWFSEKIVDIKTWFKNLLPWNKPVANTTTVVVTSTTANTTVKTV